MSRVKKETVNENEKFLPKILPESERPYEVPGNWVWVRLGDVTTVVGGGTPSTSVEDFYENGDIPWISPADLSNYESLYISRGRKNITQTGLLKSSAKLMPKGTVLLSSRAPIGYVAIAQNELCTNQGFKSFLPSASFVPEFLYFYLKNIKDNLESLASGTTFLELSGKKAASIEFPLPPLAEQQRVVNRIESLFDKLDQAKELVQSALDSFEARKAAILHKAFTGELTAKWREENGIKLEDWEDIKLGDLTNVKSSKRIFADEYQENGIPFFRSTEVVELNDEGYTSSKHFITKERYEQIRAEYGVPACGDLLVTSVGTIGKTWVVDDREFYYKDGNLTQIEQCEALNIRYLQYFICSGMFKSVISETVAGSAYNALTIVKFKRVIVPVSTLPEQQEITRILDSIFEKEKAAFELASTIEKIDHMKKAILARAFRGELGTNDPNEGSMA